MVGSLAKRSHRYYHYVNIYYGNVEVGKAAIENNYVSADLFAEITSCSSAGNYASGMWMEELGNHTVMRDHPGSIYSVYSVYIQCTVT